MQEPHRTVIRPSAPDTLTSQRRLNAPLSHPHPSSLGEPTSETYRSLCILRHLHHHYCLHYPHSSQHHDAVVASSIPTTPPPMAGIKPYLICPPHLTVPVWPRPHSSRSRSCSCSQLMPTNIKQITPILLSRRAVPLLISSVSCCQSVLNLL